MIAFSGLSRVLAIAGLWLVATTGAGAVTLSVFSGGLSAPNLNYGCPAGAANCSISKDYQLVGLAVATGTVVINPAGTVATISLSIAGATFNPIGPGLPITFGPTTYTGTVSGLISTPSSAFGGGGAGAVAGTVNALAFSETPTVSINCSYPGGTGTCGIGFGRTGFTDDAGHDWVHTFDLTVISLVPEPTVALLVAFGVAGLVVIGRRRG